MATAPASLTPTPPILPTAEPHTVADLIERLGNVPAERIRLRPAIGTATERDVIDAAENRLCELVEGTLVEKAMGAAESQMAGLLIYHLLGFVLPRRLGVVLGADGALRLAPGLVRIPDVAFIAFARLPGGRLPAEPIPSLAPDLAVEVLSRSNTPGEMARKLGESFAAGVRLVWIIDPEAKQAQSYTAADRFTIGEADGALDGGEVLPGFALPLGELFASGNG